MPYNLDEGKPRVVIVGLGIAGINMALVLKNQLKYDNFVAIEKQSSVGGTWRDNEYPGCSSDVPGHLYSLSTETNPNWNTYYISQPEIKAYWERIFMKNNLSNYAAFNTQLKAVEWQSKQNCYKLTLLDTNTGASSQCYAEVVIQAVGPFTVPLFPAKVGKLDRFKGPSWHSVRWRHDVKLAGKRVGVFGNGCSAAQFIPQIAADPSVHVVNFCRTRQWFAEKGQYRYASWIKWLFAHAPLTMRAYRSSIMIRSDLVWFIFQKQNFLLMKLVRLMLTRYMKATAPKEYHDQLIPSYSPGCKRIIIDPGYLAALHQPNIELCWDTVEEIVEDGVKLCTGKLLPLDILIFGTGFKVVDKDIDIQGVDGLTQEEYFASKDGPTAYMGTVYPGFPNYFTITGPNTATAHASLLFSDEVQAQYIAKLIQPLLNGLTKTLEVKTEAVDRYGVWIQKRLENTIFLDCYSYYRGDDRNNGRNIATFPGLASLYWWITRKPRWEDFIGAEEWSGKKGRAGKMIAGAVRVSARWLGQAMARNTPRAHPHHSLYAWI
ncbi:FAD/NAD(P)-binding domain-containing protein [Coniophora puteana RWD-64-598 SS2]|uniref:L-ornithine N(5)-monooxygenase [NAD(P)H] n=1 Tax=Coniophora puteana (strain RWD-64-598) TaxID=741705 RepID=A0A5M3N106_CONPW|nr:FAD/NAD(P)-binding domain-containing protein [Coniophora puteana RWD-64-598 SS2]EIW85072.1 FAD/NAD(P)-binding domain-containing protein [Coniophora puteana RWD-64-598 SS2]